MELITRQSLANNVSIGWRSQYPTEGSIHKCLNALGKEKNPDSVDKIIGNGSWTAVPSCSECGKEKLDFVVMVGQELDYESETVWLCKECIKKVMRLSEGVSDEI